MLEQARVNVIDLTGMASNDFINHGKFDCATAQIQSDKLSGGWGFTNWDTYWLPSAVLFGMTFFMLLVLLVLLRRRDPV